MLSFAVVCFDMGAYSFHLGPASCVFLFAFADARLFFLSAGAFEFVLLSVVVVSARSLPFALVCLLPFALAVVCIVCCWAVRPQLYLWVFHAVSHVVTNRWRIHRLWL